jgi:hypothetical protein
MKLCRLTRPEMLFVQTKEQLRALKVKKVLIVVLLLVHVKNPACLAAVDDSTEHTLHRSTGAELDSCLMHRRLAFNSAVDSQVFCCIVL